MVLSAESETNGAPRAPLTATGPVPFLDTRPSRNPFPPIGDYGFLSDCETTCLVSSSGSIEWMCVPRPDSPSVFGAILDRSAG
ncbi:MAG: glycosyl hydrolase family 15, partial [Mycobacteriaceae bacterium]|nr:glycosyl hydrolase family 15 [Mycobacteriaceae bacterium]